MAIILIETFETTSGDTIERTFVDDLNGIDAVVHRYERAMNGAAEWQEVAGLRQALIVGSDGLGAQFCEQA